MPRTRALPLAAGLLVLGLAACSSSGPSAPTTTPNPTASGTTGPGFDLAAAKAYCTQKGGTVQQRQPTYGTNGPQSDWLPLGAPIDVCRFQADDEAHSRIYLDFATLYSTNPTLAALAYLSKTPIPSTAGGANPATALCVKLGGAPNFGSGVEGGGFVNTGDPDDVVFDPCTFADGSFIEEWGIAYYASGAVRGADLSKLFRFTAPKTPVFGG